jgi:hypothetical protein
MLQAGHNVNRFLLLTAAQDRARADMTASVLTATLIEEKSVRAALAARANYLI